MANAQYPTFMSKIFVVPRFGLGALFPSSAGQSLNFLKECRYLSIPSPSVQTLRPLPYAGWPIQLSESRIMPLAILVDPQQLQFLPLPLSLSIR